MFRRVFNLRVKQCVAVMVDNAVVCGLACPSKQKGKPRPKHVLVAIAFLIVYKHIHAPRIKHLVELLSGFLGARSRQAGVDGGLLWLVGEDLGSC